MLVSRVAAIGAKHSKLAQPTFQPRQMGSADLDAIALGPKKSTRFFLEPQRRICYSDAFSDVPWRSAYPPGSHPTLPVDGAHSHSGRRAATFLSRPTAGSGTRSMLCVTGTAMPSRAARASRQGDDRNGQEASSHFIGQHSVCGGKLR